MFKMTGTVLGNLFSKSATRLYPFTTREDFPDTRGELYNDIDQCIFCKMCQTKCPSACISVDAKAKTWTYDPFACVYCGVCVLACPQQCLHQKTAYRAPAVGKEIVQLLQPADVKPERRKKEKE